MDAGQFDRLVASLTRSRTRRGALRALVGTVFGGAGLAALGDAAGAKGKHTARRRKRGKQRKTRARVEAAGCCSNGACIPGPGKNLAKCCYQQGDLAGANFKGANISGANFSGADLTGANLAAANVRTACFVDADLTGASVKGANLNAAITCRTQTSSGIDNSGCGQGTACCPTCVPIGERRCALGGGCCGGAACTGTGDGLCVCPAARPDVCDDTCVDVQTDRRHCGTCGHTCPAGERCRDGACRCGSNPTCGAGLTCCGGQCVDLLTDLDNCMGCGNVCPRPLANATVTCGPARDPDTGEEVRGCGMLCDDDYDDCNGDPLDGCEVRTTGNDTNCGFCGVDCTDDTPPKICKNCKCRTAEEPATSCDAVRTAKLIRSR